VYSVWPPDGNYRDRRILFNTSTSKQFSIVAHAARCLLILAEASVLYIYCSGSNRDHAVAHVDLLNGTQYDAEMLYPGV
jgi:hypothetical protein